MEKIASFTIDHIRLQPGVYVSRKDQVGGSAVTTFDLRMTSPNEEPVMNTAEVHTIEHLGLHFCGTTANMETVPSTLAPWAAVPDSICCWQAILPPVRS